jgi:hypothetical protein
MMRQIRTLAGLVILLIAVVALLAGCAPPQTADDVKREDQNKMLKEGNRIVGMPGITKFRQAKTMRMIQELCDDEIVTYMYMENVVPCVVPGYTACGGKLTFIGETIAYPMPYAAQFTAPESMQTYNIKGNTGGAASYGVAKLPQADPDGLFKPPSAEATWSLMKNPNPKSEQIGPAYSEPKLFVIPFKLKMDGPEEAALIRGVKMPLTPQQPH